jgi:transcriptional regulator with XRE-family HTH domain
MTDFRKIVRQTMEDQGISVYELAKRPGMPAKNTLYRWLRGELDLTGDRLSTVLDSLGVEIRTPKRRNPKRKAS